MGLNLLSEQKRLFAADRAQHLAEVVEPALAEGRDVITDRSYGSTLSRIKATVAGNPLMNSCASWSGVVGVYFPTLWSS